MSSSEDVWFLGRVSRAYAEELLHTAGVNGSFVIRSSESVPGAYALTILYNKAIHTYRIVPTENRLLAVQTLKGLQQRKFSTLSELVREYRSPQNGLICGLTNPVGYDSSSSTKNQTPALPRSDPLPALPPLLPAVSSKPNQPNVGVKVMPNVSAVEKSRDLPPVPLRDSSKAAFKAAVTRASSSTGKNNEIKEKLVARLKEFKTIWPNVSDFLDIVQSYANEDGLTSDLSNVRSNCGQCANLQTLLAREAVTFQSELEMFLTKIDVLRQLFDFNSTPRRTNSYNRTPDSDVDLDTFLGRLGDCQTVVKSLNMRVCINLQEQLGVTGTHVDRAQNKRKSRAIEPLREKIFDVKHDGALKFSKQRLKLDILKGKLLIIKGDGITEYESSKVLQLIKSKKSKNKLTIVLDGIKNREYTFDKSKEREAFCQLMQYIRNKDSSSNEPDCVSIFCGSWNMGDAMPPVDISSWFQCNGLGRSLDPSVQSIPHDIYVVGTQETRMPEKDWHAKVLETLQDITGTSFHVVATDALWHIKIVVVVKEEHKNRISHVQTSSVKTGIANALGNKGAVAVSFQFGGTSFCFINAHLTSGGEKCVRRNQNYHDIIRSLNLGENSLKLFDLTNRFDHLYFFGDLNYRLEKDTSDIQEVLALIKKKDLTPLLNFDQLKREKDLTKVFGGFVEEDISFPPTYRYERGTRETYSFLKVKKTGVRTNVPSWCDRVLWKSYPETHSLCNAYGCSEDVMTSDHSPLFSSFQVGVRGQYISKDEINPSTHSMIPSFINFTEVEVHFTSTAKQNFYIQFHSVCLTKSVKSGRGSKFDSGQSGVTGLIWSREHLPSLKPIIADREYLLDQHLLLCICSEEDNEVQGECVIALRSKIVLSDQHFNEFLSKKGDRIGLIKGNLIVKARDTLTTPKEKTYDFIRRDDDDVIKKKDAVEKNSIYPDLNATMPRPHPIRPAPGIEQIHRKKLKAQLSAKTNADKSTDGEYINSDCVDHKFSPSTSRSGSPKITPLQINSVNNINGATSNHRDARSSPLPKPTPADKPVFPPRVMQEFRSAQHSPFTADPPSIPPTSPVFPVSSSFSSGGQRRSVIDELDLGDAFAEFNKVDRMFSYPSNSPTPPNNLQLKIGDQSRSTSTPSPEPIYQSPTSVPAPPSFFSLDSQRLQAASSPVPAPKHSAPKIPSSSAYARRPTQTRMNFSNVDDFLAMINLSQYSNLLQDNGWDSIQFLGEMTEDDLNEIGVSDPQHCRLILEHIKSLPT